MILELGGNSYDLSLLCTSTSGVILFIGYVGFAYLVTHSGDFYQARRWKAALWFAGIPSIILSALFIFFSITTLLGNSAEKNTYEIIVQIIGAIFGTFTLVIPFLFVVTLGTHHQLKWWLNSDDYLDRIWKSPNKEQKSPIEEL